MATQLSSEDLALLKYVARYRLTTSEALSRLPVMRSGNSNPEAVVEGTLKRLREKCLAAERLTGQKKYYRLTTEAARLIGVPEEVSKPLGPQALPKAYGILDFCQISRKNERPRYLRTELQRDYPEFWKEWLPKSSSFYTDYCVDSNGREEWLSKIQVDLGGDYQRLLVTCREIVDDAKSRPGLDELIEVGCYRIALVTGEQGKKASIDQALLAKPLEVPFHVHVSAELLNLLGQSSQKGAK
jgi:hypothetical protein